ncbi:MAG: glycine cleavage system aminomethyltransferase GcvT [Alcaligenaceae bacterium]|nr:glycine cleavage system aminomethyltransferase GcvT [Alcaligenaceae bacterium]
MPDQLNKTPLYQAHLDAGAKMVDFNAWLMPIAYGSQIEEHHAVRQDAGVFDISHIHTLVIEGPDALAFLRYLLANDVNKINGQAGRALYTCMLNADGGVIDDLIVYFIDELHWRIVVNAACASSDMQWIQEQILQGGFDVQLKSRPDLAILAVQGPNACEKLWQVRPQWREAADYSPFSSGFVADEVMIARTGYTGEDGVEVILPSEQVQELWQDLLAAGVRPCGLGARDTLRLEAGLNLYGADMDQSTQPSQAGLSWTVSLKDESRDFIGKRALIENPRHNTFLGLKLNDRGVMRAGMVVKTTLGEGIITSGTMSPTLGFSIAMARLPLGLKVGDAVEVEIRSKRLSATVVNLPFVRHGKSLI